MKTKCVGETEKQRIRASLLPCLMSSEDSEEDGTFTVRPLPWRSSRAVQIYHSLDEKHERRQSARSKLMTFHRREGMPSDREKPSAEAVPAWCLKK